MRNILPRRSRYEIREASRVTACCTRLQSAWTSFTRAGFQVNTQATTSADFCRSSVQSFLINVVASVHSKIRPPQHLPPD